MREISVVIWHIATFQNIESFWCKNKTKLNTVVDSEWFRNRKKISDGITLAITTVWQRSRCIETAAPQEEQ